MQPQEYPSLDLVLDHLRQQMVAQEQRFDEMLRRLELMLGLVGIIFAAILGLGPTRELAGLAKWLLAAGTSLLVLSLAITVRAWLPGRWAFGPDPGYLFESYPAQPQEQTKLDIAAALVQIYNSNEEVLQSKRRFFGWAFNLMVVAFGVLAAVILAELLS